MNKFNTRITKKSLMAISVIATLLIAAMSLTTTTNANAFNFGLKSKDVNSGSIDTDSLFSCVGAAINCVNTNQNNNNEVANNTAVVVPGPGPNHEQCASCLLQYMNDTQISELATLLPGLSSDATPAEICLALESISNGLLTVCLIDEIGLAQEVAEFIINCLINAGYSNLDP
jgi:hypothetical protein